MSVIGPLLLGEKDVAKAAPPLHEIIAIVEETYRMEADGRTQVPPKFGVRPDRPGSFLHAMPAWVPGATALGMKWVSYFPGNLAHGVPDSSSIILLNDPETGLPAAILEGMWITLARTAAGAAVAVRHLARPEPRRLGLVGCGRLGAWSMRMLGAAFPSIEQVFVASRRPETRVAFCAEWSRERPWQIVPVDHVRQAVEGMDVVVTAVPKSVEPSIIGAWWSPGTLLVPLDIVSSWDDEVYARATRLVSDGAENLQNAMAHFRPGLTLTGKPLDRLQDVVVGTVPGRRGDAERCIAFVTGIASLDMTLAWSVFRRAREAGLGTSFDMA
jgi:ornithine cyclodeaminase/alanine dehydrogenase-like protein (mu-crystallin family)